MADKRLYERDPEYRKYIHSAEALAIAVIKDAKSCPWTQGCWLDVIDLAYFDKRVEVIRGSREWEYRTAFNWVIAELFPRRTRPEYVQGDARLNRYLTWKASRDDIGALRESGYHGATYLVLIALRDEARRECVVKRLKPHWSERDGRWVDGCGYLHGTDDKPRDITVLEGPDPKWVYKVTDSVKVSRRQIARIGREREEIVDRIVEARHASLELFGLGRQS